MSSLQQNPIDMDDSALAAGLAPPPPPLRAPSSGGVAGAGDEAPPPSLPRAPSSGGKNEDSGEDSPSPVPAKKTFTGTGTFQHYSTTLSCGPGFRARQPSRPKKRKPVLDEEPSLLVQAAGAAVGLVAGSVVDAAVATSDTLSFGLEAVMIPLIIMCNAWCFYMHKVFRFVPYARDGFTVSPMGVLKEAIWDKMSKATKLPGDPEESYKWVPVTRDVYDEETGEKVKMPVLDENGKEKQILVSKQPQWNKKTQENPDGFQFLECLEEALKHFCATTNACVLESGSALQLLFKIFHAHDVEKDVETNEVVHDNRVFQNVNTCPLWSCPRTVSALETWFMLECHAGKTKRAFTQVLDDVQNKGWEELKNETGPHPQVVSIAVQTLFDLTPAQLNGDNTLHAKWGYVGTKNPHEDEKLEEMVKKRLGTLSADAKNVKTAVAIIKYLGRCFAPLTQRVLLKLKSNPDQWEMVCDSLPRCCDIADFVGKWQGYKLCLVTNPLASHTLHAIKPLANSANEEFKNAFSVMWNLPIGVIVHLADPKSHVTVEDIQKWSRLHLLDAEKVHKFKQLAKGLDTTTVQMTVGKDYYDKPVITKVKVALKEIEIVPFVEVLNNQAGPEDDDNQAGPEDDDNQAGPGDNNDDDNRSVGSVDDDLDNTTFSSRLFKSKRKASRRNSQGAAKAPRRASQEVAKTPMCPAPFVRYVTNKNGIVTKVVALCNITAPTNGFDKLLEEAYANPNVRLAKTDENDHMVGAIYNIALANAGKVDEKDVGYKSWMPVKDPRTGGYTKLTQGRCTTISLHHSFCNDIHPHYISPYEFAQFLGLRAELMEFGNAARVSQNVLSVAWIMLQSRFDYMCKAVYTIRVLMGLDRFETPEMYDLSIESYDKLRFQAHCKDNVITRELLDECAKHFAWYRKSKKEKALYAESVVQDRPSAEDDMRVDALVADGAAGGSFVVARRSMDIDFLLADTGADASVEPVQPVPLPEGESVQVKQEDVEQPERPRQPRRSRQSRQSRRSEQSEQSETGPLSFEDADRREVIYLSD